MPKTGPITQEYGQNLAILALGYLASEPEKLGEFLAASGMGPDMIRKAAADPAFLAGVLDFVASDEKLCWRSPNTPRSRPKPWSAHIWCSTGRGSGSYPEGA